MREIKCPYDLNQFLLGEPIFENPFPEEECKLRKLYGDCNNCFITAIANRDNQLSLKNPVKIGHWVDITNKNGTVIAVRCSCCKKSPKYAIKSIFCPNCGIKMQEE